MAREEWMDGIRPYNEIAELRERERRHEDRLKRFLPEHSDYGVCEDVDNHLEDIWL